MLTFRLTAFSLHLNHRLKTALNGGRLFLLTTYFIVITVIYPFYTFSSQDNCDHFGSSSPLETIVVLWHLTVLICSFDLEAIQHFLWCFLLPPNELEDKIMISFGKIECKDFESRHRCVPREVLKLIITKALR